MRQLAASIREVCTRTGSRIVPPSNPAVGRSSLLLAKELWCVRFGDVDVHRLLKAVAECKHGRIARIANSFVMWQTGRTFVASI